MLTVSCRVLPVPLSVTQGASRRETTRKGRSDNGRYEDSRGRVDDGGVASGWWMILVYSCFKNTVHILLGTEHPLSRGDHTPLPPSLSTMYVVAAPITSDSSLNHPSHYRAAPDLPNITFSPVPNTVIPPSPRGGGLGATNPQRRPPFPHTPQLHRLCGSLPHITSRSRPRVVCITLFHSLVP